MSPVPIKTYMDRRVQLGAPMDIPLQEDRAAVHVKVIVCGQGPNRHVHVSKAMAESVAQAMATAGSPRHNASL